MNSSLLDHQLLRRIDAVRARSRHWPGRRAADDSPVLRAWQRCHAAGLEASDNIQFEPVSRGLLSELDDTHHELIVSARPHLESVRASIAATGCVAILTNQRGVVIDSLGARDSQPTPLDVAARKGINLDERCIGSSAPSIALAERQSSLVLADAHFCTNLHKFYCAAAPIEAPQGHLLGALDISAYDRVPGFDIMALAEDTAAAIENSLFRGDTEHVLLRFQIRAEWLGTPREAIVRVRSDGCIAGANRAALALLGQSRDVLLGARFSDVFNRDPNRLFDRVRHPASNLLQIATRSGLVVIGCIEGHRESPSAPNPQRPAAGHAPAQFAAGAVGALKLREIEMSAIENALERVGGNVSRAARLLGVSRNTIYRRRDARSGEV